MTNGDMLMRKLNYYVKMVLDSPEKSTERIYRIHVLFQYCMTAEGEPVLTSEKYERLRGILLGRIAEFEMDPIAKPYLHFRHGMAVLKAALLGRPLRRSARCRIQADHEKFAIVEPAPVDQVVPMDYPICQCVECTHRPRINVNVLPRRSARLMQK